MMNFRSFAEKVHHFKTFGFMESILINIKQIQLIYTQMHTHLLRFERTW